MTQQSFNQLVADNLPAGFSVSQDYLDRQLKIWQMLLHEAAEIPEEYKYDLAVWSDTWEVVLAYCVIYDIYMRILSGAIIFGGVSTNTNGEIQTGGEVKKIVTGPTEVEYFGTKEAWAEIIKLWGAPGGLLELFFAKACMAARMVGVKLPFCTGAKILVGPKVITFKKPCEKLCQRK